MTKMWEEIYQEPAVIKRCNESNSDIIDKAVRAIRERDIKFIFIVARGTSDHAAVFGRYTFELTVGIPVGLAAPSIFTMYNKRLDFKDTLVIAVSQSGEAADAQEVLREANRQGATTLSITNREDSPLAEEAQFHLFCNAGIEKSVAATKSFTSQIYLLALLAARWSDDIELEKSLKILPERISETLNVSEIIDRHVCRYRFLDECFILARGVNYAISLEAALKIQETSYVRAKAFATSDFMHGPIAMIDRDIPVLIFAPEGPLFNNLNDMANKLKNSKIELIVVSNNYDMLEKGDMSIKIPDTNNDIISPFYNVVVAQMFACKLSLLKGLNPDVPRMLKKITITK